MSPEVFRAVFCDSFAIAVAMIYEVTAHPAPVKPPLMAADAHLHPARRVC